MSKYKSRLSGEEITLIETRKGFCKISFSGITTVIPENRFKKIYERVEDENKSDKEV